VGIGGGARWIEFDGGDEASGMSLGDIARIGSFGQIERHQRREMHSVRQCRKDAVTIGARVGPGHHGRHQIRHDDSAREVPGAVGQHTLQHGAIAQVQCQSSGFGIVISSKHALLVNDAFSGSSRLDL
jgi:hypothetical protein